MASHLVAESSRLFFTAARFLEENVKPGAIPVARGAELLSNGTANLTRMATDWTKKHPVAATVVGTGLVAVVAPAAIAGPVLGAVGFTSQGVAGASLAAGAQSMIGNVVANSAFAIAQSAGAGGAGVAVVNGVVQAAGATVLVAEAVRAKL